MSTEDNATINAGLDEGEVDKAIFEFFSSAKPVVDDAATEPANKRRRTGVKVWFCVSFGVVDVF